MQKSKVRLSSKSKDLTRSLGEINTVAKKVTESTTPVIEDNPVDATTETVEATAPAVPLNFGPTEGGNNILAAWQGLYWLFGARVEKFEVAPEGVNIVGFTVDEPYNAEQIVHDLSVREDKIINRRVDLVPSFFYVNGETPAEFADSNSMTQFMAQYFRGAGEVEGRSPDYVKSAIATFKKGHNLAVKRGRPSKTIKIEALGNLDESILANIDPTELEKLMATLERVHAARVTA
jgi:hypothetical protein